MRRWIARLGVMLAVVGPAEAQRERPRPPPSPIESAVAGLAAEPLRAHRRFLGDTLLRSAAGSATGIIAARYVAAQFEALGLKPGGKDGSYFQSVPFVGVRAEPSLVFGAGRQTIELDGPEEFVAWPETLDSTVTVDGEVVFAGYGIEAPEWGWDDYKGVPQSGKIMLVLANDPGQRDSSIFHRGRPTPHGRWTEKLDEAAKMGALGVLLVHTDESAGIPWASLRDRYAGEWYRLAPPAGARGKSLRFAAWVRRDAVRRLLQAAGRDLDLLQRRAQQREFSPIPVGIHAAVDIRSRTRRLSALNVLGRLDGAEGPGREGVLVTTALAPGDSIRASGVATVLTAASGLARLPSQRRSVTFLATSGGVGADFYASESASPLAQIVAAVSVAGVGRPRSAGSQPSIGIRGGEHSSLGDLVATVARTDSAGVVEDRGGWYDSGAYPFARVGVPAVEITADGSLTPVRALLRLTWILAASAQVPEWLPDSPFATERGRRR
ncbi:MAG: M28 family peptidase [Gemmatimonadetes bacterium]|nr:M28 family peptidase [Gemmatimonadota bacterium]